MEKIIFLNQISGHKSKTKRKNDFENFLNFPSLKDALDPHPILEFSLAHTPKKPPKFSLWGGGGRKILQIHAFFCSYVQKFGENAIF